MLDITVQLVDKCDERFPGVYFFTISIEVNQGEFISLASIPLDDVQELAWFRENIESIKNDILPVPIGDYVSIAKIIRDFYSSDDMDEFIIGELYNYRVSHGLRFAFRGRDIPDIYIGKLNDDYQISCSDSDFEFCYSFNINNFIHLVDDLVENLK